MMQSERMAYVAGKASLFHSARQVSQLHREPVGGGRPKAEGGLPPIAARLVPPPTSHVIFSDLALSFWTPGAVRLLPRHKTAGHRGRGEGKAEAMREIGPARAGVGGMRVAAAIGQRGGSANAWNVSRARAGQPSAAQAIVNGGVR
ncbi:hypothetical protein GCM10009075_37930 [Sphingomonas trueperi]